MCDIMVVLEGFTMSELDNKKVSSYSKLTEEQRKKKIKQNQKYIDRDYTMCSIKIRKTEFEDIEGYMQRCGAVSRNSFIKDCIKYAIDNDFKGVNGK